MNDFDPAAYWESRLSANFDFRGVGDIGLPVAYNRALYRVRRRAFSRAVRVTGLDVARASVLDVGSGIGFYIGCWEALGARAITGSDLTQAAVSQLGGTYPEHRFVRFDVSGALEPSLGEGEYDAISVMDVLFHITDDQRYARAFENLAALLRPGGWLILSENMIPANRRGVKHMVSRPESVTRDALTEAGLELRQRQPMFVLMNDPVRSSSRLLRAWWSRLFHFAARSELTGALAGTTLYPFEVALIHLVDEGPSTEVLVCRRR